MTMQTGPTRDWRTRHLSEVMLLSGGLLYVGFLILS